jgi:hypothetical protein
MAPPFIFTARLVRHAPTTKVESCDRISVKRLVRDLELKNQLPGALRC